MLKALRKLSGLDVIPTYREVCDCADQILLQQAKLAQYQQYVQIQAQQLVPQYMLAATAAGWPTPVKEPSPRDIMLEAADRAHREEWAARWIYDSF